MHDAYCKHIINTINIPAVHNKFTLQDSIMHNVQNGDITLVIPKSMALTILINSHNFSTMLVQLKPIWS